MSALAILALIFLMLPLGNLITAAPPDLDNPQLAPQNPDFVKYLQNARNGQIQNLLAGPSSKSVNGYFPPSMDLSHLNSVPVISPQLAAALPGVWDWRTQGKVTSVKNQGSAGTCWLFGTLGMLESRILMVDGQNFDLSEQNLDLAVDPAWVYLTGNRSNPNKGGGNIFITTDTLTKKGTRLESADPYNPGILDSEAYNQSAPLQQRVTDFRLVADTADQISQIKNAIYTYGPVAAAYYQDPGSEKPGTAYLYAGFIYYYPNCTVSPNHMIDIMGWDDSVVQPAGRGSGAWIVKNSWGSAWGNSGYFYLSYGSGNLSQVSSYHSENGPGYENYDPGEHIYYWDEAGMVDSAGYGDNSAWMRNIFTATTSGTLTSVDFWTTGNNAQYQIMVYDSSNNLLGSQSGTGAEMGYYTIHLNSPVPIASGKQFKVDVKLNTPGYNYPLPVEDAIGGMVAPPIQAGVSFIRHLDTGSWIDASNYGYNVCLRATVMEGVTTGAATSITGNSTTLNGYLNGAGNEQASFDWGTDASYGQQTLSTNMVVPGAFSGNITGLSSSTTYHFRAKALGTSTYYGLDASFSTPPYIIAAGAGTGGTIIPSGNVTLGLGASQGFAIIPNTGYLITDVRVDSSSIGPVSAYSFNNMATNHSITAFFGQTSSVTLASSLNPSGYGQAVTITAAVAGAPPAAGTPTGNVVFNDGSTALGSAILNLSGQATYITSALAAGSHTINAVYAGDANFAASASAVLTQNIWKRGDANGDGTVDMADATKLERVILTLDPPTCGCDAVGDGIISMADVTKIERIILGLDPG